MDYLHAFQNFDPVLYRSRFDPQHTGIVNGFRLRHFGQISEIPTFGCASRNPYCRQAKSTECSVTEYDVWILNTDIEVSRSRSEGNGWDKFLRQSGGTTLWAASLRRGVFEPRVSVFFRCLSNDPAIDHFFQ